MKQDTARMARRMGPPCTSPFRMKSKLRHCEKFDESTRTTVFNSFWRELQSWGSKQMFVQSLARKTLRFRKNSFQFFLYLDGDKVQVIIFARDNF